jgi:hypothetical protein
MIAVNVPDQVVVHGLEKANRPRGLKIGTQEQPCLQKKGDDLRIELGAIVHSSPSFRAADWLSLPFGLTQTNHQSTTALLGQRLKSECRWGCIWIGERRLAITFPRWLMLAYDDEFSIQYMKKNLRPYWRRNGDDAAALLKKAAADMNRSRNVASSSIPS